MAILLPVLVLPILKPFAEPEISLILLCGAVVIASAYWITLAVPMVIRRKAVILSVGWVLILAFFLFAAIVGPYEPPEIYIR